MGLAKSLDAPKPVDIEHGSGMSSSASASSTALVPKGVSSADTAATAASSAGGDKGRGDVPNSVSTDDILLVNLDTMDRHKLRQLDTGGLLARKDGKESLAMRIWKMNEADHGILLLGLFGQILCGAFEPLLGMLTGLTISSLYEIDDDDDDDSNDDGGGSDSSSSGNDYDEDDDDGGGGPSVMRDANAIAVGFLLLGVVVFLCQLTRWTFGIGVSNSSERFRVLFFRSVLRQDVAFHDATPPGVLNSQLSYDVGLVQRAMVYAWITKANVAGTAIFMVAICLAFSWRMTLVVLVVGPLVALSGYLAEA